MDKEAKRMMYQTIDLLSVGERQQLIAYLEESKQQRRISDIVTQEELEMIYAASLNIETQDKREPH
ncbi:hypothetical protein VII00023_07914 [Vibrio ichthyoenteri ATCC 700023]|uniref:Uncharacterized protein n=1 Tax=Vibrio ichthyoenteri ATCC 700023 TaxID=870968 RepID=F9S778_9VIBR|nr:hypothetical protein [Vibrio ichthyoenteri]EGU31965.1 hypothetical protein VII00023_07914 [Vibrio ichthyoenteri ATCC 700023]